MQIRIFIYYVLGSGLQNDSGFLGSIFRRCYNHPLLPLVSRHHLHVFQQELGFCRISSR
ncbi:hypothetical protein HanRHA438_Chr01g0040561 [Helianthus annuus]|uniref:Uncharacterized protein n=1 Tax=Helianthus annuus TaxID=4232 RepID=A0A9K3JYE1_HELAN|nr:hypothetical protein HanXRQr2_Chr01g0039691 [Helianthus annuus]KAJ0949613.1 hypothetical protein HanRHA438_Chr01g0040561 [Helianthus annuus]KAJ0958391.1 hypothetical protein HanPSC8_Chr01g0038451 [Helianthus annuus]